MPIYVYQAKSPQHSCEHCQEPFEILQSMKEEALTQCPKCQAPISRLIQSFGMKVGKKHLLEDRNLKKHGFTKLVKEEPGKYRKV